MTTLTPNQKQLVYWITERDNILMSKEIGLPYPWTENKVMQETYFCNVNREDDKVTKWIRSNWKCDLQREGIFFVDMIVARLFNLPSTLASIGQPSTHRGGIKHWINCCMAELNYRKENGKKIWNGAYIVSTAGRKMSKIDYCLGVISEAYAARYSMTFDCDTCEGMHKRLMTINGLASFLAAQVVADLKNDPKHWLYKAEDKFIFSAPGPGSLRGLSWFWEESITAKNYQTHIEMTYGIIKDHLPKRILEFLDFQNLQNCLCEYDKFMRVTNKTGKSKRKYRYNENDHMY